MDHADQQALVVHLERFPEQVAVYGKTLENTITELIEEIYESVDPDEKARLAVLEMRARLVRERWRKDRGELMRRILVAILVGLGLVVLVEVVAGYGITAAIDPFVRNDAVLWPIYLVVVSLPGIVAAVFIAGWRIVQDPETRCRKCGYILRGISEPRCPECGEAI